MTNATILNEVERVEACVREYARARAANPRPARDAKAVPVYSLEIRYSVREEVRAILAERGFEVKFVDPAMVRVHVSPKPVTAN